MTFNLLILFFLIIFLIINLFIFYKKKSPKKNIPIPPMLKESAIIFEKLYSDVDGMKISLDERARLDMNDASLTYGEILPGGFATLLEIVQPKVHEVFYDLGCGTGKAVFFSALLFDWKKCVGIELLPALHECCLAIQEKFNLLPEVTQFFPNKKFSIEFKQQNLLEIDFSDADVIFLHATTFSYPLWEKLNDKLGGLKTGARVMVVSKRLESNCYDLFREVDIQMTWGESTVFMYQRK